MLFTLRKIGNSYGVIIPKAFIKNFSDGKNIELHFDMPKAEQEMVRGAEPIDPPENAAEISANAEEVTAEELVLAEEEVPEEYQTKE